MTTVDLVQLADELPLPGAKGTTRSSYVDVGGPAANAAITASILGASVSLQTVIGSGELSGFVRSALDGYNVTLIEQESDASLPIASIWVETQSGERTVLATDNAAARLGSFAEPLLPAGTAGVLVDGHYAELSVAIATEAHSSGVPIVLDCGRWRPVYAELLPLATDVIMCATFRPPGFERLPAAEAVAAIAEQWGPDSCAMTRGGHSVLVVTRSGVAELPVDDVGAVDTLGAGDVFHGGYLHHRYLEGLSALDALARSATLATESCRYQGPRRGVYQAVGRREVSQ